MEIGLCLHSISYLNENEEKVIYKILAIQTIDWVILQHLVNAYFVQVIMLAGNLSTLEAICGTL